MATSPADHQLPLKQRPILNPKHELSSSEMLNDVPKDGVATNGAVALAGVRGEDGAIRGLTFLLKDGWALEIPISPALVEQVRRIVGSMGDQQ